MKIGKYFTLAEATRSSTASRLGIDNQPDKEQLANLLHTAQTLMDPIREQFGRIRVTSGLRTDELNAQIPGSSKTSYHRHGLAFDFVVLGASTDMRHGHKVIVGGGRAQYTPTLAGVVEWVIASDLPYDQLIYEYGSWIHIGAAKEGEEPRKQALMKFAGSRYEVYDAQDPRVV